MNNEEKIRELVQLLEHIKEELDHVCCQSLMDADSISEKISNTLKKIEN